MPNPSFVPLIGSSFSDLGQQLAGYNRFNVGVEDANMQRAAEAQRQRNNYFARLADIQQQDVARADSAAIGAQQYAISRADQARQEGESRRRFDIGTDLTKEQQALERQHWSFNISREKNARDRELSLSENFAKTKADEVNDVGTRHDTALTDYQTAQEAAKTALSAIQADHPLTKFNATQKRFVPVGGPAPKDVPQEGYNKQVAAQAEAANTAYDATQASLVKATSEYASAREDWNALQKELSSYNLTPKRQGKLWGVYSPNHDQTWSPNVKEFVPAALPAGYNPLMRTGPAEGYQSGQAPRPYAGFSPPQTVTGTAGNPLTPEIARALLQEANGDKNLARQIARQRGYTF